MFGRSGTVLRRGGAVAFTLLLALSVAACQPVRAHLTSTSSVSAPPTATEKQIIAAVNEFRAAHGLHALSAEWNLEDKAHLWSAWMAAGHCGRNANGVPKICHSNLTSGITVSWSLIEENVGAASPKTNISGLISGFEHSPEHAANMLNKRVTAIGIGVAYAGNAVFVAEEFMAQ